jgi:hypothetical protein
VNVSGEDIIEMVFSCSDMINDWLSSSMKEVSMISSADNDINEFILSTGDFNFL